MAGAPSGEQGLSSVAPALTCLFTASPVGASQESCCPVQGLPGIVVSSPLKITRCRGPLSKLFDCCWFSGFMSCLFVFIFFNCNFLSSIILGSGPGQRGGECQAQISGTVSTPFINHVPCASTRLTPTTCHAWLEHVHREKRKGGYKHGQGPWPDASNSSPIFSKALTGLKRGPETPMDVPQGLNDVRPARLVNGLIPGPCI